MARPRKSTVDYFPHYTTHGKTMFILEQTHGNDGYAFWFKLLEMLGATDGHCLALESPAEWAYLQAKARLSRESCTEILNLLAELGAIDPDLWHGRQAVWSDHFLAGIADAYRNRASEMPVKPSFPRQKPEPSPQSDAGNPHTTEDQNRVDERSGEQRPPSTDSAPDDFEAFWSAYPRHVDKTSALKCWKTRLKEGHTPASIIEAARNYAAACKALGTPQDKIKHPSTFIGVNHALHEWQVGGSSYEDAQIAIRQREVGKRSMTQQDRNFQILRQFREDNPDE